MVLLRTDIMPKSIGEAGLFFDTALGLPKSLSNIFFAFKLISKFEFIESFRQIQKEVPKSYKI